MFPAFKYLFLLVAMAMGTACLAQGPSPQQPAKGTTATTDTSVKARYKVYGLHTRYTTIRKMEMNPDTLQQVDTGLTDVHQFDPVLDRDNHYTFLGNNASPAVPMFFDYQHQVGFGFGFHQWDVYRMTDENMRYYNTRSPFTDFQYAQGPTALQYFKATHTQNITPYWNVSIAYRKYYSTGFYDHQLSNGYNFGLNTWYRSKSRRYMLTASAIWNTFRYQENGGLVNDSFFTTNNPNADHIGMPFRLTNASQQYSDQNYNVRQYLFFGTREEKKIHDTDSVATVFYYPRFYLSHSFNVYSMRYNYYDSGADERAFADILIDSIHSNDNFRFRDISNTFSIGQVEYHNPNKEKAPFSILLNGFVRHDIILARIPGKDSNFQNVMVGGGISINTFFRLRGDAALVPLGYNQGDYSLSAKIEVPYKIVGYKNTIGFAARNQESRPDYLEQTMYSNHFEWNNNFIKTRYLEGEAFLYSDSFHYRISAKYDLISSLVYYDTGGMPAQAHNDINYFMLSAEKDFIIGGLHLNNSLIYQHASGDYIRVPDFSYRGSYFYEASLFKAALVMQFGVDLRYNSAYYAYAYMPGSSVFYQQNYSLIGNYPYFDLWLSGRISRFRIFGKVEHITEGLFGYRYFSTPSYPFYPRTVVRLGLRWMFYN